MKKGLVSIITPCYNTAHLVSRLLDSVVRQTYIKIEMFMIDDGSTDNIKEVAETYRKRFEDRGYVLEYIYQSNQGQSAAINNGLKLINGEYVIWPDSDDWFRSEYALQSFVKALQEHDDSYAVVRSVPTYVNEIDLSERLAVGYSTDTEQFENCLYNENFFWGAGNYMARVSALDKAISSREIYVAKNAGQNWQLLLPLLYKNKCVTLMESYLNVLERQDSHSRGLYAESLEKQLLRIQSYEETIVATLQKMHMSENERIVYLKKISSKYLLEKINVSIEYKQGNKAFNYYRLYQSSGGKLSRKRLAILYLLNIPILRSIYLMYSKNATNR